jgi:hypothetical protein
MAKHSRVLEDVPSYVVPTKAPVESKWKWLLGPIVATVLLLVYILAAFLFFAPTQAALFQRLLGSGCALLALLTYLQYTKPRSPSEALLLRLRMAEDSDFGKQLLAQQIKTPRTVKLPWFGETRIRMLCAIAVFCGTLGWWMTSFAPVRVKERPLEDLTGMLGEKIAAVVLLAPDGHTVLLQPPLLPTQAKAWAEPIRSNADAYARG